MRTQLGPSIFGTEDYLSLVGTTNAEAEDTVALGIAIGAPVKRFAHWSGRRLKIFLNHYGSTLTPRPLIYRGSGFISHTATGTNISSVYDAAVTYFRSLPIKDRAGFGHAVSSYLQARSLSDTSYELKVLAAYHFLEWFDGSRTMSANVLADTLSITRAEAKAVCVVRNSVVHSQHDLGTTIRDAVKDLRTTAPEDRRSLLARRDDGVAYMNYLFTILGDQLLRTIGYQGKTSHYFTTSDE